MSDRASPVGPITFDEFGPCLGPVRLLEKTGIGFRLKPPGQFEEELTKAFGVKTDVGRLMPGLAAICRAMNERDLARAAIAACLMPMPKSCGSSVDLVKASPEDPLRPGWPKGAPDGEGGEFRPKNDADATGLKQQEREKRIRRLKARRTFRSLVRRILTTKRVVRLLGEFVGDIIPGIDVASDIATVADLTAMAEELAAEVTASRAALEFAEQGPRALRSLLVDAEEVSFSSYSAFLKADVEKRYGPAGEGYEYHHVVEQGTNAGRFSAQELQSTGNIIRIPKLLHEEVNAFYAGEVKGLTGGKSFRDYLRPLSYEQQRAWGYWALDQLGITK